jgi:hypothetical protein
MALRKQGEEFLRALSPPLVIGSPVPLGPKIRQMTAPRHRGIGSAILIDTFGRLLFQQRDDVPASSTPNEIALFGGHREGGMNN